MKTGGGVPGPLPSWLAVLLWRPLDSPLLSVQRLSEDSSLYKRLIGVDGPPITISLSEAESGEEMESGAASALELASALL